MKKRNFILMVLLLACSIPGLTGTGTLQLRILRPALITLPERIDKIFLAERSCGECLRSGTGRRIYGVPDTNQYSALGQLRTRLDSTGRYTIKMSAIDTGLLAREQKQVLPALSWDEVGRLTNYDTTAILIVLEEYDVHFSGDYAYEHRLWRMYDYASETILDEFEQLHEYQYVIHGINANTYLNSDAIEIYACRIMPHWEGAQRSFYKRGDQRMKQAAYCLQTNDWNCAFAQWKQVAADSMNNRELAAQACYNLALYFEVHDSLVTAQEWVTRAQRLGDPLASSYADVIRKRILESGAVAQQMAVNQGQLPIVQRDYTSDQQWKSSSRFNSGLERRNQYGDSYYENAGLRNTGVSDPR